MPGRWDTASLALSPLPLWHRAERQNGSMVKRKKAGEELDAAERQQAVVALRRDGLSFREIAEVTGLSKSTVARRYQEALAMAPVVAEVEEHKRQLFAEAALVVENLRWAVHDDEHRPRRHEMSAFLRAIEIEMRLLGLYAPARVAQGSAKTRSSTNVHLESKSMWSAVLANPREEDPTGHVMKKSHT